MSGRDGDDIGHMPADYHLAGESRDWLVAKADPSELRHALNEVAAEEEHKSARFLDNMAAEEAHAHQVGARRTGRTAAITAWAAKIAEMFTWNKARRAVSLHMSQEASRYSASARPMSTQQRMYHYARQSGLFGLDPLRLERASADQLAHTIACGVPRFRPAQRRRLRHKLNRQRGTR
jgi:hypothetical protein